MYNSRRINNKGWIALDIDGTVTDKLHTVPDDVREYLKGLALEGWRIMFITGRIFSLAYSALQTLDFFHYLALQNGADILELPSKRLVSRSYLSRDLLTSIEEAYFGMKEDFIIYAGYDEGDFCYYRPKKFSQNMLNYLQILQSLSWTPWKPVSSFDQIIQSQFPLVKCFGKKEAMQEIYSRLVKLPTLHATMIRDNVGPDLYLILVTALEATKGHAIDRIVALEDGKGPIIAAGDDFNDIAMLKKADVRIVMETAPEEVRNEAHIIAPPAAHSGIIEGLKKALQEKIDGS